MRSSMAHNVGQGFLNDAKGCDLNGGRERRQMFWRGKGYTHIATLLSRDGMFTNSRDQAKFIEHRWTQGIDQAADIGNGRANLPFERLQQCYCFLGLVELTSSLLPSLGIVLSLAQLLALLLGLFTVIDIIVLTLALVRFQRSRLMLIGK
jgi:hypothetical protein